jgi:hypothetical protein
VAFWYQSIRTRLTIWYTLLVLLTLAGFAVGAYLYTRETLSKNLDRSLQNEVRWVKDYISPKASRVKPSKRTIDALLKRKPNELPPTFIGPMPPVEENDEADEIWNQIFKHSLLSPKKTFIQVSDKRGVIIYRNFSIGVDSIPVPPTIGYDSIAVYTAFARGEKYRTAVLRDKNFTR